LVIDRFQRLKEDASAVEQAVVGEGVSPGYDAPFDPD